MASDAPTLPWLSIVGIGEDGLDGLSPAARRLIAQAQFIVGGARHIALAGASHAEHLQWPSPLTDAFPAILARRGAPVVVLASGDPFFFGVGSLLAALVPACEFVCLPAPSAFSLAAARLGWAQQDCALLSLHGRPLEILLPHIQPGARILALAWDGATAGKAARLLRERGCGTSNIVVFENMGGVQEKRGDYTASAFTDVAVNPLNTIALEITADPGARILPLAAGLPDNWFEHDGQITKRHMRAMTLAALTPQRGELLWDIGAGSGSVAIEWMLRHPANRAVAIERSAERAARIARNALSLGVPGLIIQEGRAPDALAGLPAPDAIFIGGGASSSALAGAAWRALRAGGRLVINAVTLEGQAELLRRYHSLGGDLVNVAISHADPVGAMHGWRPAMPVMQWRGIKPA